MILRVPHHRSLFLLVVVVFFAALAAGQVQTAPITEPRAEQNPAPPVAQGAAAIVQSHGKCFTALTVNADALFMPHRWTLNPDASQTLDVLGPMITKAGKHSAEIIAYTAASESNKENRDVGQRRALTVRTWLVNHQFLPAETRISALSPENNYAPPELFHHPEWAKNGIIEVAIDTCH